MPSLLPTIHRLLRVHRLLLAAGALLSVAAIRLPGQSLATVPPSSSVHLTSCASETRTFRVCLSGTTAGKTDVYLLADTTGSMGEALSSVQSGANALLTAMLASPDIRVGVGRYQDFPVPANPYCFEHQLSPSNSIPAITAAINSWAAGNGIDTPEGQLFALHQLATSGTIGWRPGARPWRGR